MQGNVGKMKETCIYWRTQANGVKGNCMHPDGPMGQCVFIYADECTLKEELEAVHTCALVAIQCHLKHMRPMAAYSVVPTPSPWSAQSLMMRATESEDDLDAGCILSPDMVYRH
jgi:hypothetical protein